MHRWQIKTPTIAAAHATPSIDFEDLRHTAAEIIEISRCPRPDIYPTAEDLTEEDEVDMALLDDNDEVDEDDANSRALQINVEAALAEELEADTYTDLYRDVD